MAGFKIGTVKPGINVGSNSAKRIMQGTVLVWQSLTAFLCTLTLYNSRGDACDATASTTKYHDGVNAEPVDGDYIYNDAGGSWLYAGHIAKYMKMGGSNGNCLNGLVSNRLTCP